jgi:hypothetical protein
MATGCSGSEGCGRFFGGGGDPRTVSGWGGSSVMLAFVDVRRARWKNSAGWLWLILLGPIVAGTVAALSPFAVADSAWPSRVGYLMVLAVVWLAPLLSNLAARPRLTSVLEGMSASIGSDMQGGQNQRRSPRVGVLRFEGGVSGDGVA